MLNIVFVGHLGHGKSTLIGRLFYELGKISEQGLTRLKKHAEATGLPTSYLAFFTDKSIEERQRGGTIETSSLGLEIEKRFTIIDTPGDKNFLSNIITGISQADLGGVLVDVNSIINGVIPAQTEEYIFILKSLGIESLIILINKIDTVGYSQEKFEVCRKTINDFLLKSGFVSKCRLSAIPILYIPTSAYYGDNLVKKSDKMEWYKGTTLYEAIVALEEPARTIDKALRMPILRTFNVEGAGAVILGRLEAGSVKPGDTVTIAPYPGVPFIKGEVQSIEWQHQSMTVANTGDAVSLLLSNLDTGVMIRKVKKGAVVGSQDSPPEPVEQFKAEITVFNHNSGFKQGYSPYLHIHQASMPCSIAKIIEAEDKDGNNKVIDSETRLVTGDRAVVQIKPHKLVIVEEAKEFPRLGYFILRDGVTIASGICLEKHT